MRVLHCIATMGGGGAERQLCYLSAGLVARGHEVTVALQRGGPNLARLESSGARVLWIEDHPATDPRLFMSLVALLRRLEPDVLQTWLPRMDVVAGLASVAARVPWVLTERSSAGAGPRRLREALARASSAVVANSVHAADEWSRAGATRVQTILNAVPVEEIDAAPRADLSALGVPPDAPLILYCGRFADALKNVLRLADALIVTLSARPEAYALCVGDGPDHSAFCARVAEAGLSHRCLAPGYADDIFPLLRRASVFISPSYIEGRPNALVEALAARVPTCVSRIPAHTEFVDDESVLFFDPTSRDEMVAAIASCLDDPAAASARAARARAGVEAHSIAAMSSAYESLYRSITHA